jgi:hypothetical protein
LQIKIDRCEDCGTSGVKVIQYRYWWLCKTCVRKKMKENISCLSPQKYAAIVGVDEAE